MGRFPSAISQLFDWLFLPNNTSRAPNGEVVPNRGFEWTDHRRTAVEWAPRKPWPERHLVAGIRENEWLPDAGYVWCAPDGVTTLRVRWMPQSLHPSAPFVVASAIEGKWMPAWGFRWVSEDASDLRTRLLRGPRRPWDDEEPIVAVPTEAERIRARDLAMFDLGPGASHQEIHAAFRKRIQREHPDKFEAQGRDAVEAATRRFVALRAAYLRLIGPGEAA